MAGFRLLPTRQRFVLKPVVPVVVTAYFVESLVGHLHVMSATDLLGLPEGSYPSWFVIEGDELVRYSVEDFSLKYCREHEYIQGLWK